jgi:hypothetical protein
MCDLLLLILLLQEAIETGHNFAIDLCLLAFDVQVLVQSLQSTHIVRPQPTMRSQLRIAGRKEGRVEIQVL